MHTFIVLSEEGVESVGPDAVRACLLSQDLEAEREYVTVEAWEDGRCVMRYQNGIFTEGDEPHE